MQFLYQSSTSQTIGLLSCCIIILSLMTITPATAQQNKFEPYQLNGGLVSAVAAKDFVVIASDTRFMGEGGYDIVSRDHIESRLWVAGHEDDGGMLNLKGKATENEGSSSNPHQPQQSFVLPRFPTFVGSAGCNADCEALKRTIQADLRSAVYFGECGAHPDPPVDQVATLLSQVLFSRRTFPFYSFCVVAGLSHHDDDNDSGGQVFIYDAIGSYEQVAVASSGTGRELIQPILDRKFRTMAPPSLIGKSSSQTTMMTTVPTQVDCTSEEAVSILMDAYRSVSEREIGVGDNVVICVLQRRKDGQEGVQCHVYKAPLKKH